MSNVETTRTEWDQASLALSPGLAKRLIKRYIRHFIATSKPVSLLMIGLPGAGKTAVARQAVEEVRQEDEIALGYDEQHPGICEPPDISGQQALVKRDNEIVACHLPYERSRVILKATDWTVVLFDDLIHAILATQNALTQIIWARKLGDFQVSPKVMFLAASNDAKMFCGGNSWSQALLQRWTSIVQVRPDLNELLEWGEQTGCIHPYVAAYLRANPAALIEAAKDPRSVERYPSPRNWEYCSDDIYSGLLDDCDQLAKATLAGSVGPAHAAGLWASIKLLQGSDMPRFHDIFTSPSTARIPDPNGAYGFNKLWAVCGLIGTVMSDPERLKRRLPQLTYYEASVALGTYASRLPKTFEAYLFSSTARREAGEAQRAGREALFCSTPAYLDWARENAHQLSTGVAA